MKHRPRQAFTLLELILALSMAAVLAVSLFASLSVAFKARSSAEAAIEPGRTSELAMSLVRAHIESALPPTGTLSGAFTGVNGTDERGHPSDTLDFYTTADSPEHVDGNGEIKLVELAVEVPSGSSDHVLVRRVRRNLLAQNPPDPDEEVLCRGVASFSMRYFDGSEWQVNWDSTQNNDTLPAAIEVTLELDRPDSTNPGRTLRYVRVFPLSCSTTVAGSNGTVGGNTGLGL